MTEIVRAGLLNLVGELSGRKGLEGLKVGDLLTAIVLEKSGNDEVLLSLKGSKVPARTEAALSVGDRISLRVEDLAGKVELKVVGREVPEARQIGELVRDRIPRAMNVGGDYSELRTALRDLLRKSPSLREGSLGALLGHLEQDLPGEGATAGKLKAFVENSGIFYERKLAASLGREAGSSLPSELKSLILEAKTSAGSAMESNPGLRADLDRFLDISEKVLKNTEVARQANTLPVREGGQASRQGSDIAKGGLPQPSEGDISDPRAVVSQLLEKAPALKNGSLGELMTRLEQVMPREEASTGKLSVFVKSEDVPAARQKAMAVKGEEGSLLSSDLKALILDAKETARAVLERNPGLQGELDRFLDVSERVLKNTEVVQLANSLAGATGKTFWAVLPYSDGEKVDSVEWEVRQGRDNEGSEGQSFSLTFNLSGLGKVKVDGLLSGGRLHCHFWGDEEEIARFMEGHLDEFSRSAEAQGMAMGSLACGVSRESGGGHLQRIMTTAGIRLVDRRA